MSSPKRFDDVHAQVNAILTRARDRAIRGDAEGARPPEDESREPIMFISCGQYTDEERKLGQDVVKLVQETTNLRPYFAEDVSNLEGLTRSIFSKLDNAVGLICVMHDRGQIQTPNNRTVTRASVWIEQELAIAAFLNQILDRNIEVIAFCEKGVDREGVRQYLHLNPIEFEESLEVLSQLRTKLPALQSSVTRSPSGDDCIEIRALAPIDHPRVRAAVSELQTRGVTCVWRYTDELVGTGDWKYVEVEGKCVITYAHRNHDHRERPPEFLVYQVTPGN